MVLDLSPRLTQKETHFDTFENLTDAQLEAADGSGALMIVKTIRLSVGPKSIQEGVRLLLDFFRLDSLRRNHGETLRHWTRRFTVQSFLVLGFSFDSNQKLLTKKAKTKSSKKKPHPHPHTRRRTHRHPHTHRRPHSQLLFSFQFLVYFF